MKIEEAIKQLEEIAQNLESGNLTLEQAMDEYTKGVQLVKLCSGQLNEAKLKIEEMKLG